MRRLKIVIVPLCGVAMLLGMAGVATARKSDQVQVNVQVQVPQTRNIEITATDYHFAPSEIFAKPGDALVITLTNKGQKAHNIRFDLPGGKTQLNSNLAPGQTGTLSFTAPGPGIYSFDCPVDLHSTMGMKGRLIVEK
jgi:plastocyanin